MFDLRVNSGTSGCFLGAIEVRPDVGSLGAARLADETRLQVAVSSYGGSVVALVPGLLLVGAGMGLCLAPITTLVLAHVEPQHAGLSVRRQCELLGLNRSSLYYEPAGAAADDLRLMALIDRQYTAHPFYGSRRMTIWLRQRGEEVNRKRVQRLMRVMGLEAIHPRPRPKRNLRRSSSE